MKKINHLISALIMAAMTAGFASCSSSDEPSSVSDNTPKELTLTIMSTKPLTKAALNSTSAPTETQEKTINRITVGIFSSNGNEVRTIQEFSDGSASSTSDLDGTKFYNPGNGSATVKVVTTQMVATDVVAIAINAPSNKFKGVQTLTDFKAKSITADEAIANSTASPVATNIPMYGQAAAKGSGTTFTADVTVKHLTAKVTLESLSVNFDANGPYSDASFTPTEIFLYSVPVGLQFDDSNPYITPSSYLTGKTGETDAKEYLSSGAISSGALSGTNSMTGNYYFYTTPNNNTGNNKTKLVIKGNFKKNSSDTSGSVVYYPVKLNSKVSADGTHSPAEPSTTEYQVYPNKNYKCSVTIKTIGSSDPSVDIDPTTAEITITVDKFEDVSQETVFQ